MKYSGKQCLHADFIICDTAIRETRGCMKYSYLSHSLSLSLFAIQLEVYLHAVVFKLKLYLALDASHAAMHGASVIVQT